MPEVYTMA